MDDSNYKYPRPAGFEETIEAIKQQLQKKWYSFHVRSFKTKAVITMITPKGNNVGSISIRSVTNKKRGYTDEMFAAQADKILARLEEVPDGYSADKTLEELYQMWAEEARNNFNPDEEE